VPLRHRQEVVAALAAVDYVTSHGERRMRRTLELLKPDLYIKGGDYDVAQLTSRGVVEAYGGQAVAVAMKPGLSFTAFLKKAAQAALREGVTIEGPEQAPAPAAFLDRDGVILKDVPYLAEVDKVELRPGATRGLRALRKAGFRLVIVTNQAGIGLGYFSREDFFRVNGRMLGLLNAEGVTIDAVYFCPHSLAAGCSCRKPGTALLERASRDLKLRRRGSWFFGDREVDMATARAFGIGGALIGPGDTPRAQAWAKVRAANLAQAARAVLLRKVSLCS
jgi:histidinol-phosphate phosphatase family protein